MSKGIVLSFLFLYDINSIEDLSEASEKRLKTSKIRSDNHRKGVEMVQLKKHNRYEIDMCKGPLVSKILLFAIPLALSGILQQAYNAADMVVVGRFVGSNELAAIGSVGSISGLLVSLFMGLSVGVNILVARYFGSKSEKDIEETVHTSILISVIAGVILTVAGMALSRTLLEWMDTPEAIISHAVLYMRIYFLGTIGMLLYNFGAAVLRGVGNTRTPLYILLFSGAVNVILNLVLVLIFHMGVAGVGIATIVSQYLSAVLVVIVLMKTDGVYRLDLFKLRIVPDKLKKMASRGIPTGLESALFNIANVLIQSSVNSFGEDVVAGNTAGGNIEAFAYIAMNCFYQATISFVSQNYGARQFKRINKVILICCGFATAMGLILGNTVFLAGDTLLKLYTDDPDVIYYGKQRLMIIGTTYFLCGLQEVMRGALRGLDRSVLAMTVSLVGACGLRILWINTVFRAVHSYQVLLLCFPISYIAVFGAALIFYWIIQKKNLIYV